MTTQDIDRVVGSLTGLPAGSVVAVNAETGEYVTATTEADALEAFEERYGWGVPAVVQVVRETRKN
jgi:hypothetical protein